MSQNAFAATAGDACTTAGEVQFSAKEYLVCDGANWQAAFTLENNGHMKAGDAIQLVDSAATCDGTTAGSLRYNSSEVQYCNGTAWTSVGSGGASAITELTDVTTTAPTDGQVLTWDNANSTWKPADAAASINALSDIANVTATAPTDGQVLAWDNANSTWKPVNVTDGSAGTMTTGWPDTITCTNTAGWRGVLSAAIMPHSDGMYYYVSNSDYTNISIRFNPDGSFASVTNGTGGGDCNQSIAQYYAEGRAFNFIGGNGSEISLSTIADVSVSGVTDGQVLTWDNANSTWKAADAAGGAFEISGANAYYSAGSVGVGTVSPSETLHVVGNIRASGNIKLDGGAGGAGEAVNLSADMAIADLNNVSTTAPTDGQVLTWDNANSTWKPADAAGGAFEISGTAAYYSAGNVGVGTSVPQAPLQVKGSSSAASQGLLVTTNNFTYGSAGSYLRLGHGAASGDTYGGIDNLIGGGTAMGNLVLQKGGGNVGIGTTSPAVTLDVSGTARIGNRLQVEGAYPLLRSLNTSGAAGSQGWQIQNNNGLYIGTTDDAYNWQNNTIMHLKRDGNVGIGTTAPSVALDVSGTARATSFIYSSDARLKENVKPIADAMDIVNQLEGVRFNWKDGGRADIGVIAQEVEKVLPELVHTADDAQGTKAVEYANLVAVLIEAAKEQNQELKSLRSEVDELRQMILDLKK